MTVNRQRAVIANLLRARESDAVKGNHRARSARLHDLVIMPLHRVEFVADVEGIHHLFASALRVIINDAHDGVHAFIERRVRWIRHQLIVLDKINSRFGQSFYQFRRLRRRHSNARFDDRADERTVLNFCQRAATSDTEFRPAKIFCE